MRIEFSAYFEEPRFKATLRKYESMMKDHAPTYMEGDELSGIAEYYAAVGREEEAEKAIEYGLKLHPDDLDLLIYMSRTLALKGDTEEARKVMNRITDQSDREVKFLLFDILNEEEKYDEADRLMDDLAAEENYSLETMLDILQAYLDNEGYEKADEWYGRMCKAYDVDRLVKTDKRIRNCLCDYYMDIHEPERCIPILQEMLDETPYSIALWNDLAQCYMMQNDLEKANESVDFSLAIDDKDTNSLILKSTICQANSQLDEALKYMLRAAEYAPESRFPYIHMNVAEFYLKLRKFDELVKLSESIQSRLKPDGNIVIKDKLNGFLAVGYMSEGQYDKGLEYLIKVRSLFSNAVSTHVVTGHCCLIYGEAEQAKKEFDIAINTAKEIMEKSKSDDSEEVYYETVCDIAALWFDYRHWEEAGKLYKELLRFDPDFTAIMTLAMYAFAKTRDKDWFYYIYARIHKEWPPQIIERTVDKEDFHNPNYAELLAAMRDATRRGDFVIDDHLDMPE